jgi:PAS domain S-box-containing protein
MGIYFMMDFKHKYIELLEINKQLQKEIDSLKSKEKDIIKQGSVFEEFADIFPEIIFEIDIYGKVVYANNRGLILFGYDHHELNREVTLADIFTDNLEKVKENLKSIKFPGQTSHNEYIVRKKDGSPIPILTNTFAIFKDGKITGYRGVVIDMSAQKKYEEQIIREKAFLEHLVDSAPEAIAITTIDGKITMINKEFTRLFGYATEEVTDKLINDLVVPDEYKEEALQIDYMTSQNQKKTIQTIRKDKHGNRIYVTLITSSIVINDETVAYLGIYRNITSERKNQLLQEILYNISTAALKESDIKNVYPIIVHELGKIWDTNNFFIALYDKTSDTLSLPFFSDEKDNFREVPAKNTITGWVIKNNKSVLLKEQDIKKMEEAGDIDLIGTPCKVWMGVPLRVESDTIGVMCLQDYQTEDKFSSEDLNVMDFIATQVAITIQRRSMMDNLIIARQKAEEAAQSKQVFMSTMSHEIRTPLNNLIGIATLLLQENPREDQMELLKALRFSGNHLQTLVNDVLDFSKMESGKTVFEQTQFNLSDFLGEMKRSYSFWSKEKQLEFDILKSKNLPVEVIGDPIRLNQILSNLLSNAFKFTDRGSIIVKVNELKRTDSQSVIEFIVKDTGIGIQKEKHSEIFNNFTQASTGTADRFSGTGLGLAICKKLIELQGGNIKIESESNKGTTFTFILTFGVSEQQQSVSNETKEAYKGLEGKRILIAEDNKINYFVASKFLNGWGVKVTHAENGQLALDILKNEEFDLILMDLQMPILDGIETSRIIRSSNDPKIKDLPIIALTAAIMSESHDRITDLNINDYVLKPFKPQDLFNRILKHIK